MPRVKIQLQDGIKRVVTVNTDATVGAQLGTDLFLPNGRVATPDTFREWLGVSQQASGGGSFNFGAGANGSVWRMLGGVPQWGAPAALTKTDDTNVTLTLGGSHASALLGATSITAGWAGQLGVSRGGTNIGSYAAGDLLYASGSATLAKLPIGSNSQVLTVVGGVPAWSSTSAPIGANPTAQVGLSAVNGSATTFMRSDAAPALNQGITPTWTGVHTFAANPVVSRSAVNAQFTLASVGGSGRNWALSSNTDGSFSLFNDLGRTALYSNSAGNVIFSPPGSGNAVSITGVAGGSTLVVTGASGAAANISTSVPSGNDNTFRLGQVGIVNWDIKNIASSGQFQITNGSATPFASTTNGNVTINAPVSGDAVAINPAAGGYAIVAGKTRIGNDVLATGANLLSLSTDQFSFGSAGAASSNWYTNAAARMSFGSSGNGAINAPSSGDTLSIAGAANGNALFLNGSATAGQSYGLSMTAGTNTTDYALYVADKAGTGRFRIYGEGSITTGTPTGGAKGAGTINAAGDIYVNNSPVCLQSGANFPSTLLFGDGSAGAPSISFASDTNTGIYRSAADTINIATNGVSRFQVGSAGAAQFSSTVQSLGFELGAGGGVSNGMILQASGDVRFNSAGTLALQLYNSGSEHNAIFSRYIRLPHTAAPGSPQNGDMWTTSSGLFVRINGATVGPLGATAVSSGTYTPTGTTGTNVSAVTTYPCQYMRVGDVVTVSGRIDATVTGSGSTALTMSLPVSSNMTQGYDLGGAGAQNAGNTAWAIRAEPSGDTAQFTTFTASGGSHNIHFSFTYRVI